MKEGKCDNMWGRRARNKEAERWSDYVAQREQGLRRLQELVELLRQQTGETNNAREVRDEQLHKQQLQQQQEQYERQLQVGSQGVRGQHREG